MRIKTIKKNETFEDTTNILSLKVLENKMEISYVDNDMLKKRIFNLNEIKDTYKKFEVIN